MFLGFLGTLIGFGFLGLRPTKDLNRYHNVLKNTPIMTAIPIMIDITTLPEAGSIYARATLGKKEYKKYKIR